MLFQHRHRHPGAGEQEAGHHARRTAADNQDVVHHPITRRHDAKVKPQAGDRRDAPCLKTGMAGQFQMTPALSDALTILGAAGIVIPTFARFKINPVIGFILVGIVAGPFGLGALTGRYPWLEWVSITDPHGIEPFAEFGIVLLLFSIGLELSFRRLVAMRRMVFGIGAAELLLTATLIGGGLWFSGW